VTGRVAGLIDEGGAVHDAVDRRARPILSGGYERPASARMSSQRQPGVPRPQRLRAP
jgi:hypothetical protein